MKKSFTKGLIAFGFCATVVGFVACGDESSSGPSKNEETGIETEVSSSSEISSHCESCKDEAISSSRSLSSSSNKKIASTSSSSWQALSSTPRNDKKSSSSGKGEKSSSSKKIESSSSSKAEVSSSSTKNKESSSSVKTEESSSSSKHVETSSSETKPVETSSSESNSSSESKSSSSEESSSSKEQNSSSSLESTGICKTPTEDNCIYGTLHDDRDGKNYKTIKIGTQEWMAENLNYEISRISKTSIWSTCYENSGDSCAKYGRYYTWTAAIDSIALYDSLSLQCGSGKTCSTIENYKIKGICPDNSHLPSLKEWQTLLSFVGASKAGKMLKSTDKFWGGEDSFGFSVLPSGRVTNSSPDGGGVGEVAYFWTTKDSDNYGAKSLVFYSDRENVQTITSTKGAMAALTVRCIKD